MAILNSVTNTKQIGESQMAKPSVNAVKEWELVFESDLVKVEVGTAEFPEDYWRVIPAGGKPKYFYGETAWSDSQRYAGDIDFSVHYSY